MKNIPPPLRRSCEQKNGRHLFEPFLHRSHPWDPCTCHHTIPRAPTQHIAISEWSDYSSQPNFLNLLQVSNYQATTLLSSQLVSLCREFDKISLKNLLIYSMRYKNQTHNTIPTDPYDELRRTVFHKAGHTGSAFYSSAIFQQSGTFNIKSSLKDHERTGCQYIFQGYFTDLYWILERQETTCWIHSTCAKPARHSWTTNKFAHQWNVVTS